MNCDSIAFLHCRSIGLPPMSELEAIFAKRRRASAATVATQEKSSEANEVADLKRLGIGASPRQAVTDITDAAPTPTPQPPPNEPPPPTPADLLGGLDAKLVDAQNARAFKIAYITAGSSADPCVIVAPGGGATKEENLFWARELASLGPFYVIMYDLRGTGGSEPRDRWAATFAGTTPIREMERVVGIPTKAPPKVRSSAQSTPRKNGADIDESMGTSVDDGKAAAGGLRTHARKHWPAPLNPAVSNCLHDFDGYVEDAIWVLDELGIRRAHFVGLSQGGVLARLAATLHPERVLSVVSCSSTASKLGLMMAAFSAGAEEFYDQLKAAALYDEDGKPPWGGAEVRRASRDEYVPWRSELLAIIVPGFDKEAYEEMAGRSWDAGYVDEAEGSIGALAYEAWERRGKDKAHLAALKTNATIPMMFVHGKKDPVIHFGESQKLFAQTGNCVLETHEYGHNFGPPRHQTALLGRMATFMRTARAKAASSSPAAAALQVGTDTFAAGVSAGLGATLTTDKPVPELWDAFCTVQTAADTTFALEVLLATLGLSHLRGQGLSLFVALQPALEKAGLKFSQKKLLNDLNASMLRAQKVVARQRGVKSPETEAAKKAAAETADLSARGDFGFNHILVCGAGPVGLRAACELALLGFRVTVVEKRPNFSRANILTFWDETMCDMLALGAKSYFPSLQPTGTQKSSRAISIEPTLALMSPAIPSCSDHLRALGSFRSRHSHGHAADPSVPAQDAIALRRSGALWHGDLRSAAAMRWRGQVAGELSAICQAPPRNADGCSSQSLR